MSVAAVPLLSLRTVATAGGWDPRSQCKAQSAHLITIAIHVAERERAGLDLMFLPNGVEEGLKGPGVSLNWKPTDIAVERGLQ